MSSVTAIDFNPYDYRFHEDPYPTYARLRDEEPLFRQIIVRAVAQDVEYHGTLPISVAPQKEAAR